MAFTLIAQRSDGLGLLGGTTGAFDSTGADLIVVVVASDAGAAPIAAGDLSDSKSNTYVEIGSGGSSSFIDQRIFYCAAPTVGSGHTVTVTVALNAAIAVSVQAWSGAHASPAGATSFLGSDSGTTTQPGSLTPPEDNCLVLAGIAMGNTVWDSIDSGFTLASQAAFAGGSHYGCGSGYKVQTSAGAENPTFTISVNNEGRVVSIAVFKSAGGVPDPPNATYALDSQPCEGSNGTITPTNTGGAITSSAVASGSLPTGYVLNANGTISKTGASMVVGDIGSRTVYVNLTNAGGTQSNVPVPIVITANPPVLSYAGSPFTKYCGHASSTANITASGPAVPAAGYALSSALGGLALNTTTAVLTFDPDLTEGVPVTLMTVSGTSTGGQVGQTVISLRFSYQFTVEGTNAGGSDTSLVTLHVGGGGAEDSGSIRRSSFGESSFRRGSFRSSSIGRGRPFR